MEVRGMEEVIEVPKEKCMKVTFPNEPKIRRIFERLPPPFKFEESGGKVTVYCPLGYEIGREFFGFGVKEFYKVFKALEVENGRKIWRHDMIVLEPKKTKEMLIRMAPGELHLLRLAAERAGETLSDYIRAAAFTRMARELGL